MLSKLYLNRGFCTAVQLPRPWLFVGLGNPGDKFKGTRHNAGFNMIDTFAESQGIAMDTVFCVVDGVPVLLAKPQTYMNLSGESVSFCINLVDSSSVFKKLWCFYYAAEWSACCILQTTSESSGGGTFHDDMDLPCGVLRLQPKGGHGSHNGMKSVIYHFRGNREFVRLRIGIGKPPGQMDPKAFLLQKFNATAQERIDIGLKEGVAALKELVTKGLTEGARVFNNEQKYKHIKIAD
ncbi:hypothetical protein OSB04_010005 [Centaurea solstitialis]|uniref:Peptidyl-tRNA hydrolase n=1 Tax=Centaurea solstitialis TaxID=347529 RepID=A0AA38TJW1_9ASTR|nr:hypothetical protein OSB04_010005 [Centaurea solstitialis]